MCGRCRQNASASDLSEQCSNQLNGKSSGSSSSGKSHDRGDDVSRSYTEKERSDDVSIEQQQQQQQHVVSWKDEKERARYDPRENVTPGSNMAVLLRTNERTHLVSMKWGLVPSYVKSRKDVNHWKMFNARSETVLSNGVFSRLVEKRRCAIPMNGFYEWQTLSNVKKQPFYLTLKRDSCDHLIYAAGLYDIWIDRITDEKLYTFTILTMDACVSIFNWLHERQPVLLNTRSALGKWLDCENISSNLALKEARFEGSQIDLTFNPVTHRMTNPKYQGKDCSRHVDESSSSIKKWFSKKRNRPETPTPSPKKKTKKKKKKMGIERFFSPSPKKQ